MASNEMSKVIYVRGTDNNPFTVLGDLKKIYDKCNPGNELALVDVLMINNYQETGNLDISSLKVFL